MAKKDPRTDAYILAAEPFARPVLKHIRKLVHTGCPELEETFKWSFPVYTLHGKNVCHMAAFKQHCAFGFWNEKQMKDPHKLFPGGKKDGMGSFGKIRSLKDLPSDKVLLDYIREAAELSVVKKEPRGIPATKKPIEAPPGFLAKLRKNKRALETYNQSSPAFQREYLEWMTEAKTEVTREKRIETSIEWLSEGKERNWKYQLKK